MKNGYVWKEGLTVGRKAENGDIAADAHGRGPFVQPRREDEASDGA